MSITRKIILGYIILVFIPVIAFGYVYYKEIYGNLTQQFVESRQKVMEQAYANMRTDFARIQSVHRMLQYNPYVTDYLDGVYTTDAESVYSFIRYIHPLYVQSVFVNPEIESLTIYKMKEGVFPITGRIIDRSKLDPRMENVVRSLKPGQGAWVRADSNALEPELIYYQYIYNTLFTEKIGLIEIRASNDLIKNFYQAAGVEKKWKALLLSEQGTLLTQDASGQRDDQTLRLLQKKPFLIYHNTIVNQITINELGVRVVVIGQAQDVFHTIKKKEIILVAIIVILLLACLSFAYFVMASTITKRILRLARHMRSIDDDNLGCSIIQNDRLNENDEIWFLTETYNSMLMRMDELINKVHRAELRNKEAAYKVMQAQIKPHFLYNTLETIRMLAESNNDMEVADISFWFGKLMRYSLSSEGDEATLAKEIEMVEFYLKIHKMRLQSRMTYEIDVDDNVRKITCPQFMLQPLIENCIVHGVSVVLRPVHIRLQAIESKQEIRITVSDNGNGIPPDKLLELQRLLKKGKLRGADGKGSVGMVNVNDRINAFFGGTSRLEISSKSDQGTRLCIIIGKRTESES